MFLMVKEQNFTCLLNLTITVDMPCSYTKNFTINMNLTKTPANMSNEMFDRDHTCSVMLHKSHFYTTHLAATPALQLKFDCVFQQL